MQGRLLVIDAEKMEILQNVPTGYYPVAVDVFSPQTGDSGGKTLAYVANRFGGDVSVLDLDQGREIARYPFGREPIALAVSPDGKKLIVVPHLPEDTSIKSAVSLLVRVYDTETGEVKSFRMQNESMNAKDVVFSPDGRFAFITCIHGHFDHVTNQLYGGWMFENVVEVVDVRSLRSAEVIPLDEYGFAAANPWGIRRSEDSRFLFVAHAGSCEISILNLEKILHSLDSAYPQPSGLLKDLPLKVRVPVGLYGVRQLAVHENRIYCTGYFEDSIGRTDFQFSEPIVQQLGFPIDPDHFEQPHRLREPAVIADRPGLPLRFEEMNSLNPMRGIHFDRFVARLGPAPVLSEIRLGSLLFHDARICFEHWASCVSCHPDGRADGLNWDLLNDGIGNPKNTKSMLLSHETPPAMVSGIRKDAETAVRSGLSSILFADRPESDAKAIDEYLKSLQPVPSPYLIDGKLSESAKRGEKLFHSSRTGCAECHSPPLFTDLQLHDVGTMSHKDSRRKFDTPTLIEVWRTAPYMHDGRYKTIDETIFEGKKHVNTDGKLDRLTPQEKKDLVQYVLSL